MTKLDPIAVAVEMLKAELPAFETRIDGYRDSIAIRGALPIGAGASFDTFLYPLMRGYSVFENRPAFREVVEILESPEARAVRLAKERKEVEDNVRPGVEHIANKVREFAIEAVNARRFVDAEVAKARAEGTREGYASGHEQGKITGRRELLAEWRNAVKDENDV